MTLPLADEDDFTHYFNACGRLTKESTELRAEIARLRTQCGGNCRYWEGRWRDEKADNERLTALLTDTVASMERGGFHVDLQQRIHATLKESAT